MRMKMKIRDRIISGLSAAELFSSALMPAIQVFAEEIQSVQETAEISEILQQNEEISDADDGHSAEYEDNPGVNDNEDSENNIKEITAASEMILANEEEPSAETSAALKLTDLSLKLTSGVNEEYVFDDDAVSGWKADKSNKGHEFTYSLAIAFSSNQSNHLGNGRIEAKPGDIQIHIPLHTIKDQSGKWADELTIWYPEENDPDIADTVKYVYRIDEEHNEMILYNRIELDEAQSVVIPFSYMTTKETWNYKDMEQFECQVKVELTIQQGDEAEKKIFEVEQGVGMQEGNYVCTNSVSSYINTEANMTGIQKSAESDREGNKLRTWDASWGISPADADQYLYTVWKIESKFSKVTQKYTFDLKDVYQGITQHDGTAYQGLQGNPEVVGYKLSGQSTFSDNAAAENQTASTRTDYVLVRYEKSVIENLDFGTYQFTNDITGTADPQDRTHPDDDPLADADSTEQNTGYFLYVVEQDDEDFIMPAEKYELSKYGIYGANKHVDNNRSNISSYQLRELIIGGSAIEGLTYELQANLNGYIRTLAEGTVFFTDGQELKIGDIVTLPDGNERTIQNGTRFGKDDKFYTFLNAKTLKAEQLGTGTKIKKNDNTIYWIVDKETKIPVKTGVSVTIDGISYVIANDAEITIGGALMVKDGEGSKQVFLKNNSIVAVNGETLTVISGSAVLKLEIGDIVYPSDKIRIADAEETDSGYRIQNYTKVTLTNEDAVTHQKEIVSFMDSYGFSDGDAANFITGTQQDAADLYFGRQNVTYVFTDEDLKLGNSDVSKLINTNDTDYYFTELRWNLSSMDAGYSIDQNALIYSSVWDYSLKSDSALPEDANIIRIWITKDGTNYSEYQTIDLKYVSAQNSSVIFPSGVTGWKFEFSSPYASHNISLFPKLTLRGDSENVQNALAKTKQILEQDNYAVAVLNNEGSLRVQDGNDISSFFDSGYELRKDNNDFIASVMRRSQISKSVSSDKDAVKINKGQQYVAVKWITKISETIQQNTDVEPKVQESGTFYDYLPLGSTLLTTDSLENDVAVYSGNANNDCRLQYGTDYTYSTVWDTAENRQKLIVNITASSQSGIYSVVYYTRHNYWDINDYGRTIRNSVAYRTGNDDIANGRTSDGGGSTMQDAAILAGWIPPTNDTKYLYEQAYYTISSLIPSSAGISKKVATPSTAGYVENGILNVSKDKEAEAYSYQVRWANSTLERAKEIIILDSLENYQYGRNASIQNDVSEWHGTLTGFDFSSLESNGVDVKVYLTTDTKNSLNFGELYSKDHSVLETDLEEIVSENDVAWTLWDGSNVNLDEVTAFAVDLRKKKDGTDYILGYNQSFNFIIHMKAPALKIFNEDEEQQGHIETDRKKRYDIDHDPETNNSIFRSYDSLFDNIYTFGENSQITIGQENATVKEFIVKQKTIDEDGKVKAIDQFSISCSNVQYVSYEETEELETKEIFRWEQGSPELLTIHTGDKITYTDNDGTVQTLTIGVTDEMDWISYASEYGFYAHTVVTYHAVGNMKIAKANEEDISQLIPGITFHLQGTSWYDTQNDIDEEITTNEDGYLVIENLPRGEYTLKELPGNADWVLDTAAHSIVVDAYGNTFLDNELLVNDIGIFKASNSSDSNYREENGKIWFTIDDKEYSVSDKAVFLNKPRMHGSLTLRKVDALDNSKQLYGAEFTLKSDSLTFYGNEITEYAVSGADGSAIFDDVEQGKYTLTESIFPDGYVPVIRTYQVICDKNGNVEVTGQRCDSSGAYIIENTPYAELKLRKLDNVNQSEVIEGAEFTLTLVKPDIVGTVDDSKLTKWTDGKQVETTSSNGIIEFSQLLDGEYTLVETAVSDDNKHIIDEENPPTYKIVVKENKIIEFSFVSGTDEMTAVFDDTKITGEEWQIYNNRAYENQVTVNKKWIGIPMENGFPVIHLTTDEPQNKIKVATIDRAIFSQFFDVNTTAFVRHGEGNDSLTLEEVQNYSDADLSDEGERYSDETGSIYMWKTANEVHFWTDAEIVYLPDDCEGLLSEKTKLTSLDFSGFFCDKVTTMKNMFSGCTSLKSIDFGSNFTNGGNVTTTKGMFRNCTSLQTVDLDTFQTSGLLTDTSDMFRNCKTIQTIRIGSMDTSGVTDMSYMFGMDDESDTDEVKKENYAKDPVVNTALTSLALSNLDTSSCTTFRGMFQGMSKLKTINLDYKKFTAGDKLTTVARMFNDCKDLTGIDLRGFGDCPNLTSINRWFRRCNNLKYIDLANFSTGTDTTTHLADISLSFYLTGKYDNNDTQYTLKPQDGCAVYTKGKWYCTPEVKTYDDKTFDCFRILLYGEQWKNANEIAFGNQHNVSGQNAYKIYGTITKGDPKHLDIQIQGNLQTYLEKAGDIRLATGYFNDSNSDYYKNVFYPATYGVSSSSSPRPLAKKYTSMKAGTADTDDILGIKKFGYTCETGEKTETAVTPNENETYEDTITYKVEYITGNGTTSEAIKISDTEYTVPETIQITAVHIWYDNAENPAQKYEQETVYTKEATAVWERVNRTKDSEWICKIEVYDKDVDYYVYEDVLKDRDGKNYNSSARLEDKLKMTDGMFTITNSQEPIGSLSISKVLTDGTREVHKSEQDEFTFKITLKDKDGNFVTGETAGYKFENGETTVTVKTDETVILSGIPAGYTYAVDEAGEKIPEGYQKGTFRSLDGDAPASGKIDSNTVKAVTWQNTIDTSSFTLKKIVTDSEGNKIANDSDTTKFTFYVNLSGLLQNYPYVLPASAEEPVTVPSSDAGTIENLPVTLKNGESVAFTNLPIGAKYRISEVSDTAHYTTTYQVGTDESESGYITALQEVTKSEKTITFTNQKLLENEPVSVRVQKVWEGEGNDTSERPESIKVLLHTYKANIETNPTTNRISSKGKDESFNTGIPAREESLNASNDWTYAFENLDRYCIENNTIQYEYYYEVEEIEVSGYTTSLVRTEFLNADVQNGITDDQVGDVSVVITNTKYPSYYLQISKEVDGNLGSRAKAFTFELTAYQIKIVGVAQDRQVQPPERLWLDAEGTLENFSLSVQSDGTAKGTFSLTDGDYLKINSIPEGTYVAVKEIGYETEGYDVSAVYQFDGKETKNYNCGEPLQLNSNLKINCKNERSGALPTGQDLQNKQFIFMSITLLSCIALLQWKRKKSVQ